MSLELYGATTPYCHSACPEERRERSEEPAFRFRSGGFTPPVLAFVAQSIACPDILYGEAFCDTLRLFGPVFRNQIEDES